MRVIGSLIETITNIAIIAKIILHFINNYLSDISYLSYAKLIVVFN